MLPPNFYAWLCASGYKPVERLTLAEYQRLEFNEHARLSQERRKRTRKCATRGCVAQITITPRNSTLCKKCAARKRWKERKNEMV